MAEKAESREGIKRGIERRKGDLDERGKIMDLVVKDKKKVSDTSNKLRLATTREGVEAVKKAIRKAAEATHTEFKKQNIVLEKKFGECKKAETDLQQRTTFAKQDASQAKAARGRVEKTKDAKALLAVAEGEATKDAKFTDDRRKDQERDGSKSKNRRDRQKDELQRIKLSW